MTLLDGFKVIPLKERFEDSYLTISEKSLKLNRATAKILGDPQMVVFLLNEKKMQIALTPAKPDDEDAVLFAFELAGREKPIYVKEDDDLIEKLREYEESISTMRYELMEENGIYKRSDISNYDYIKVLKEHYKNLEFGKIDVNRERKYLYNSNDEFYKFHHINDVPFDEFGNMLDTKEVIKLKTLNKKHNI